MSRLVNLVVLFSILVQNVECDGIVDEVFRQIRIQEGTACYRLLNGTNQYGCHASNANQNGILVQINNEKELENLKSCYRNVYEKYNGKFWVMLPVELIKRNTISLLKSSNCTSGLVLYNEKKRSLGDSIEVSHDAECPNRVTDFYKNPENVNSKAAVYPDSVRNIDWNLQMIYIKNSTELEVLRKCISLFNEPDSFGKVSYPYCGMSFKLSNSAAGNSDICYRRGLDETKLLKISFDTNPSAPPCVPLIGHNIFGWPVGRKSTANLTEEPKYMVLAARMDSFGLIPEVSPGEISVLTSLIAMISAARAIGESSDKWERACQQSNKYLMFAAFNGESFDYIGSSAAVHKMLLGQFPLPAFDFPQLRNIMLKQIEYIVEVQQIGTSANRKLYALVDNQRYLKKRRELDGIFRRVQESLKDDGFTIKLRNGGVTPPSSWHSFAKFDENVQSFVIAPFEEKYEYGRYNSMLDQNSWTKTDETKVRSEIVAASNSIISAAAEFVGLENATKVDEKLVGILFECLVKSEYWLECDFLKKLNGDRLDIYSDAYSMTDKSTYISVASENPLRYILHWLYIFALGSDRDTLNVKDQNSCMHLSENQAVYSYDWQPNPFTGNFSCLRSSTQYTRLQSPAFEIEGYSIKTNRTFSTWTESLYTIESARLFIMEDSSFDYTMLLLSIAVSIFTIFAIGRCNESTFIVDEGDQLAESGEPL